MRKEEYEDVIIYELCKQSELAGVKVPDNEDHEFIPYVRHKRRKMNGISVRVSIAKRINHDTALRMLDMLKSHLEALQKIEQNDELKYYFA